MDRSVYTLGGGAVRAGMGPIRRGLEFLKPVTATSAVTAAGETEAEAPIDMMRDIAAGTAEGTAYGGAFGLGGKGSRHGGASDWRSIARRQRARTN
jgi:hypothetical protein